MEHRYKDQVSLDLLREAAGAVGCHLNKGQFDQLNCYVIELLKWNQKSNLTAFISEKDVIGNLVADSLAAVSLKENDRPHRILDVGTGGGVPGVPLKIAFPCTSLTLVEPNQKKVAFLYHIVGTLDLENTTVEAGRIEQVEKEKQYHGTFDWVVIKALRLEGVLPYVSRLLSERGCVICWRAKTLSRLGESFGFRVLNEISYKLPFGFGTRILSVMAR